MDSEDTVLFTMQRYLSSISCPAKRCFAKQRLAPLVRCQHLSQFWLAASLKSQQAGSMVLSDLRPQLRQFKQPHAPKPGCTHVPVKALEEAELLSSAPASWALARRARKPVSSVDIMWELSISTLGKAAQRSVLAKQAVLEHSPTTTTPTHGLTVSLCAQCAAVDGGCEIGLFAVAQDVPADAYYTFRFAIAAAGVCQKTAFPTTARGSWGFADFFSVGVMAGGWDEAAWTAKGLPTCGDSKLSITLKVQGVIG